MKRTILRNWILLVALFLFVACNKPQEPLKVAVSYISGDPTESNYIKWMKSADPGLEYIVMNKIPMDSVELVFDECSALLLTGGQDVYPGRYSQAADTVKCGSINFYRDSLEFSLIDLAIKQQTPILGVCRGQQILNIAFGGSLFVDIPTEVDSRVSHRCQDWKNCFHDVVVLENNLLSEISGIQSEKVTTNHHQAIKRLADDFKVMAVANDGIIESIGWKSPEGKPFLLAVQWHPERMDSTNALSRPLLENFLMETRKYHLR